MDFFYKILFKSLKVSNIVDLLYGKADITITGNYVQICKIKGILPI
jgi:hypothetical protein